MLSSKRDAVHVAALQIAIYHIVYITTCDINIYAIT